MIESPRQDPRLIAFLRESLMIEGIHRPPTSAEIAATTKFLSLESLEAADVIRLQAVYAPKMPLRRRRSMNVRIGSYYPPTRRPGDRTGSQGHL